MTFSVRTSTTLDLDASDPLQVIKGAFDHARDHQMPRLEQYKRDYQLFNGFIDMSTRDPDRSNVFIPKIRQIIRTKVPRSIKALSGQRPYIPFDSRRPEFSDGVRVWVDYMDQLLEDGNWVPQLTYADLIAHVYGTGFLDFTPRMETVQKPLIVQGPMGPQIQMQESYSLAMDIKAWAPWEVYVDPFATGLELPGQCRYLVKLQLASRREILKLHKENAYPGLDVDKLMDDRRAMGANQISGEGLHPGLEILQQIGLSNPRLDKDIGVLMRFESDDRYIDSWNGDVLLREVPNPYPCECIHTARIVHGLDPHTQNQFFGLGDVKPNEVLQELLNDMYDQAVNSWNMMDQPVTYYDKNAFDGPANQLVRTMGNKIPIDVPRDRRIQDTLFESYGHELPASHFNMLATVRDFMDMGSESTPVSRGEISDDDPTATEVGLASERSSDAQELDVRLTEHITLRSFGRKVIDTVCRIAPVHDIIEMVGLQRATQALMANPVGIPGGFNMTFKGSDRVQNMALQQRQWLLLSEKLMSLGSTLPGALSAKLLEVFDEDSPETLAMIIPDQVRMMMEAQQQDQEHQRQVELKKEGGAGGGKDRKAASHQQAGKEKAQAIRNQTKAS